MPSWLLSTNGLIQIVMRLVGLANGKPRRCYYTCDHMIFMKWVISLNNITDHTHSYTVQTFLIYCSKNYKLRLDSPSKIKKKVLSMKICKKQILFLQR